ncbi:MAG: DKNYY domain-containing protein [Fimbriiglobus sp.]
MASIQRLNDTWSKDQKNVFCAGRKMAKADVTSFQVLNDLYAKDANHGYYLGGIIKEADATSFEVLDDGECVREHHNSFGDHVRTDRSLAGFAADEKNVFHYVMTIGKPCILKKAHRKSFEVLGYGFGRDQQNVYFEKSRLQGADAPTFEVIPPHWGKDKKSVYYGETRLPSADPQSFVVLSSHDYLAEDATHYYDRQSEIPREQAFRHGSPIAGYPLSWVTDVTKAADYLRRGATPHDRLALNAACRKGNTEMVKLLLAAGCDPRITDAGQNSCLTDLCYQNYLEIAKLLIEAGADVNHMQEYSPTQHGKWLNAAALYHPLQQALFQGRWDLADYLISVGADIHAKTGEGYRLIDYFRKLNNKAAVNYLVAQGA